MKKIKIIALIFLATLISCTAPNNPNEDDNQDDDIYIPPPKAYGSIKITGYEQSYYSSLSKYSDLKVYYEVKNTGFIDMDYFKIYFKVICEDSSEYFDDKTNSGPDKTHTLSDYTYLITADKKANRLEIMDFIVYACVGDSCYGRKGIILTETVSIDSAQ